MARIAGVGDLQTVGRGGRDKSKGVGADVDVRDGLLDLRHVTAHALVAAAAGLVVRVLFNGGRARSVGRFGPVALQTHFVSGPPQVRVVGGSMNVVATEAGEP